MASKKTGLRLNQVVLRVRDIDRSLEFYTEKLGFKLHLDFSPHYAAVLTANKLQIGLAPREDRKGQRRSKRQAVGIEFEVDNVDRWYQRLRARGIRFSEKPKEAWGEREARFKDPDGYTLAISSRIKKV